MKKSLSGLDLIALTKELQALVNCRVDKVYQPEKGEIEISIAAKGEGKLRLKVGLNGWIWLSKSSGEMPVLPSSFASQLRKHISNARITAVSQHGCDRIIELSLQKETASKLIFELFGDGNVLLVADDAIVALLKHKKMKHRELRIRGPYSYPPEAFDPRAATKEAFIDLIRNSNADIVRTLATKVNLGGDYAEEICQRACIPKETSATKMDFDLMMKIWDEIQALIGRLNWEPAPHISFEGDQPLDVAPIALTKDAGLNIKHFSTFSEAIDEFVKSLPKEQPAEEMDSGEKGRLERTLATQLAAVEKMGYEIEESQEAAEFLFSNYATVEKALDHAKKCIGSEAGPGDLEIINRATGEFRASVGKTKLILNWKRNVTENAQDYYDDVKKLKAKLEGATEAIKETQKKIEKHKQDSLERKEETKKKTRRLATAWHERYRWFVSSEGVLVVAGTDAKSNDQLVKKHLQPGDRYVHADIHGAPSVVVKAKEGMTEATLREAAVFSLAMSKAWNAGHGSGSAYWVTPEQVSKTPQSGEFLPKGAWVIRGKRNYFERLEIRLAIGMATSEKEPRVMCGPVSAIEKNCASYVVIESGEMPKETAAKEFAKRFSADIEDIQSALPPGGIKIVSEKKS
jgi:predicted ribosome quality control (RQC) complex YloA/Tae2 family protein